MELLTPEEVAALLNVRRKTVIAWLQKNKLPGFKLGEKGNAEWRVDRRDMEEYLAERCGKPHFEVSTEDLERKTAELEPVFSFKPTYAVEIGGRVFPIKQLLLEMTGLPPGAITTLDAYEVFRKLGYSIRFQRII
ncbi:MAG: helix-turn-helix domain-containing protein [Negativicutes bacterium]|nr:helix-turn-helix domain-containing protein [Negativicutes bacterium]